MFWFGKIEKNTDMECGQYMDAGRSVADTIYCIIKALTKMLDLLPTS
jgi:hypothetical protein